MTAPNTLNIPIWAMPVVFVILMGAAGLYITDIASKEAERLDKIHTDISMERLKALETQAQEEALLHREYELNMMHMTKSVNQTNKIVVKMAAKLNVEVL